MTIEEIMYIEAAIEKCKTIDRTQIGEEVVLYDLNITDWNESELNFLFLYYLKFVSVWLFWFDELEDLHQYQMISDIVDIISDEKYYLILCAKRYGLYNNDFEPTLDEAYNACKKLYLTNQKEKEANEQE